MNHSLTKHETNTLKEIFTTFDIHHTEIIKNQTSIKTVPIMIDGLKIIEINKHNDIYHLQIINFEDETDILTLSHCYLSTITQFLKHYLETH